MYITLHVHCKETVYIPLIHCFRVKTSVFILAWMLQTCYFAEDFDQLNIPSPHPSPTMNIKKLKLKKPLSRASVSLSILGYCRNTVLQHDGNNKRMILGVLKKLSYEISFQFMPMVLTLAQYVHIQIHMLHWQVFNV